MMVILVFLVYDDPLDYHVITILQIDFRYAMPLKVNLRVVMKENTKGEKIASIESIKKPEDEVRYVFPPEYQTRNCHLQLFNSSIVKKAANSLTKVGHYRNIALTMDDETAAAYIDTDLNFAFQDIYLEEAEITPTGKQKLRRRSPVLTWKDF
jgi:hypothetical protein